MLKASPGSAVASFCEHVDTRLREALQHQRFPVHVIENKARLRSSAQTSNRVILNFIPTTHLADVAGATASGWSAARCGDAGLPRAGVWSQCHSYAFDVSVWEIFGALLRGGRLVVVPESVAGSPEDLHGVLVA